ncbi:MAG: hypothetical protein KA985_00035 [Selenomonas sp.]|nr:hypothetical protein [Selenomonas sp.]
MAYLLMTAGIMALGLFLASRLANACGFLVKGRALALAGILACGIAMVLPILAPFLTRDYYWKLGLLVLIAALLVTAYNARLVKKDLAAAEQAAAETPASAAPPEQMSESARQAEEQAGEARPDIPMSPVQPAAAAADRESDSAAPAPDAPAPPQETAPPAADAAAQPPQEETSTADTARQAPQTEAPPVPIAPAASTAEDSRPPQDAAPPPPPVTEEHASARHAPAAQMPDGHAPEKQPSEAAAQTSEKHAPEAPWAKDFAALTTLDAFLDYAYAAQQRGDIPRALAAYREALKRYFGDPYVPYLFIDLGNLCKQQARYADCIEVYRRGLRLPIIAENEAMAEEFHKNIRYLRIVYHILEKHQALATPFSSIPQTYRAEIETAYQAAQAQHHGS